MYVQGLADDVYHLQGYVYYSITMQTNATVSFDWSYACADLPALRLEPVPRQRDGHDSVVHGRRSGKRHGATSRWATVFALGVWSQDGWYDPGQLIVSNFVPEPSCLALLALGTLVCRRL